jgi:hypothetical protein
MALAAKSRKIFIQAERNGTLFASNEVVASIKRSISVGAKNATVSSELIDWPKKRVLGLSGGGKLTLNVEADWEGFYRKSGEIYRFAGGIKDDIVVLDFGDLATIAVDGISINLRVGRDHPQAVTKFKLDPAYQSKMFGLTFSHKDEVLPMIFGLFVGALTIATLLSALFFLKKEPAQLQEDLEERIALEFISPDHLRLAPEALQKDFRYSRLLSLTGRYYRAAAAASLGLDSPFLNLFYSNSIGHHRKIQQDRNALYQQIYSAQEATKQLSKGGKAAKILLPSVYGQSLRDRAATASHSLRLHHQALRMNYEMKIEARRRYESNDMQYVEGEYRNVGKKPSKSDLLSQIHVLQDATAEERMYIRSNALADLATTKQLRRKKALAKRNTGNHYNYILEVDPKAKSLILEGDPLMQNDERFAEMNGQMRGYAKKALKPKYLITGKLSTSLIKRVVEKNSYEIGICYELALRRRKDASGKAVFSWIIDPRGQSQEVKLLSSTIENRSMEDCLRRKIIRWKFPRPLHGSVKVNYPFAFVASK